MPIYNNEKMLKNTIDSILNQTIYGFELILVNDGSTDASGQICDEYARKEPLLIEVIHQRRQGLAVALNKGLFNSTGEYVYFADPTDTFEPRMLQSNVKLAREKNADLVVFGMDNEAPFSENLPTSATNPYGQTKVFIEHIIQDMAVSDEEWSAVLLRYFNPIGAHESGRIGEDPNDIPNNLMPYITQVAVGKLAHLSIFGDDYDTHDGTGVRDYIHVLDLAQGHLSALDYTLLHKGVEAVNLGTGEGYSVLDVVHAFEQANGVDIPYEVVERRPGDIAVGYADPTKAKELLGWESKYSLEDMCRTSWNWQKNNPNGYAN